MLRQMAQSVPLLTCVTVLCKTYLFHAILFFPCNDLLLELLKYETSPPQRTLSLINRTAMTRLTRLVMLLVLVVFAVCVQSAEKTGETPPHNSTPVAESTNTGEEAEEPVVQKELTERERAAVALFERAMETLNDSKPDRLSAFQNLIQAALLDHVPSQELVARAHLFGDDLPLDLKKAATMFKKLAAAGNPTAQLVSSELVVHAQSLIAVVLLFSLFCHSIWHSCILWVWE